MLVICVKMIPTCNPKTMIVELVSRDKFVSAVLNLEGKETTAVLIVLEYLQGNANFLTKPVPALEALGFTCTEEENKEFKFPR